MNAFPKWHSGCKNALGERYALPVYNYQFEWDLWE
jgi:hypothetical protein